MDTTPLAYLIPSAGGLMATCVGFYYHKAKVENALKLSRSQRQELTETINEIDSVTPAVDNFGNTFAQY